MAIISDTTKIDKSFKFASGKAYTTSQKGVDNEDAPGGFIIGTSSIFSQDGGIPTIAPGVSTSILTYYDDGTVLGRFRMIYDISSPLNKAWYASTDGSSLTQMRATRQGNWVPPTFGNYTIRIFLTKTTSTTIAYLQEIFFSDASSPLFDYKSGILTFESDPLAAYASISGGPPDGIQISAYRYTGPLLSQIFDGNGNYTGGLSDFLVSGTGASLAKFVNPGKSFEVSSPHAIQSLFIQEHVPPFGSAPQWKSVFQLPNGQILAGGSNSGNTVSYVTYNFGQETPPNGYMNWFSSGSGLSTLTQVLGIWAPNNTDAYAVGAGGATQIGRSFDGGKSWITFGSPGIGTIKAIWGSSLTDIFILGSVPNGGAISHAVNGLTYTSQVSGTTNNLVSIWGSSSSDIYAVGASGTIRHSTGTGTWTGHTSGTANDLKSVFGVSATDVYAVGNSGTVLASHVLGTWVAETGLPGTFFATGVWGVKAGSTTRLYICGNTNSGAGPGAVYTSDGGGTWTLHTTFGAGQLAYSIYGGTNGVYVGSDNGNLEVLHQNPVLFVDGNAVVDGYLTVRLSLTAQAAEISGPVFCGPLLAQPAFSSSPGIQALSPINGGGYAIFATAPFGSGAIAVYGSAVTGLGTGAFFEGGDTAGSVGIETRTNVLRDSVATSSIQNWYGLGNSGQQLVGTMDSFGSFTIDGYMDMKEVASNTLNGAITNSATTIIVFSTDGFPISDTITIDAEQISYTGKTATQFTGCTRGVNGTTASNHLTAAYVQWSPKPAAAHGRLYFRSNGIIGAGHRTQLAVRWPNGSETVIAESPAT